MKLTIFSLLFFASLTSFSQTVHTRIYRARTIQWDESAEKFIRDTTQSLIKTKNPKIIMSYDVINIIDGDTTRYYLNETPKMDEDSVVIKRIWSDANDETGRECFVLLHYDKEDDFYTLRIIYQDDESGLEYNMSPLKVDIIPYSNVK